MSEREFCHGFVADLNYKYFGTSRESNCSLRSYIRLSMAFPVGRLALDGGLKVRIIAPLKALHKQQNECFYTVC